MRIVHATPYADIRGGRSFFVNELASMQAHDGNKVFIIGKLVDTRFQNESNKNIIYINIMKSNMFRMNNLAILVKALRIANKYKADVLHIHGPLYVGQSMPVLAPSLRLLTEGEYPKRVVYTLHAGVLTKEFILEILGLSLIFTYKLIVVVLSPSLAQELRARGVDSVFVPVFYRRDIDRKWWRRAHRERNGTIRILYLGGFNPLKGIYDALAAFNKLIERCNNISLTIAGGGENSVRERVTRYVVSRGLSSRVRITGWLDGEQYIDTLYDHDVLLHPSRYEGLPLVIADALAAGLAVVAYPVGGIPVVVLEGYNGFLFRKIYEIVTKLSLICRNRSILQRFSLNARKVATTILSPRRVVESYYLLYNDKLK